MATSSAFVPECTDRKTYVLSKDTPAFGGFPQAVAGGRAGLLSQLPSGAEIEVIGAGFSERTVKVQSNGVTYVVFLQDLENGADYPAALYS